MHHGKHKGENKDEQDIRVVDYIHCPSSLKSTPEQAAYYQHIVDKMRAIVKEKNIHVLAPRCLEPQDRVRYVYDLFNPQSANFVLAMNKQITGKLTMVCLKSRK